MPTSATGLKGFEHSGYWPWTLRPLAWMSLAWTSLAWMTITPLKERRKSGRRFLWDRCLQPFCLEFLLEISIRSSHRPDEEEPESGRLSCHRTVWIWPGSVYSCESKCLEKSNELIRIHKITTKRLKNTYRYSWFKRRIADRYNHSI